MTHKISIVIEEYTKVKIYSILISSIWRDWESDHL